MFFYKDKRVLLFNYYDIARKRQNYENNARIEGI